MTDKPSRWANLRDICSAVREMVIVIAMLVLLIAPSFVKDSLERAGIRSVAGVEFDMDNLAQSRDELDAALAQIDTLRNQLTTAQQQVQGLAESSPMLAPSSLAPSTSLAMPSELASPTARSAGSTMRVAPSPSLASVSRLLASMKDQAEETDRSLRRSKVHADQVLEQASRKMQLTPPQELFGRTELYDHTEPYDHTGAKPNDASESSVESPLTR